MFTRTAPSTTVEDTRPAKFTGLTIDVEQLRTCAICGTPDQDTIDHEQNGMRLRICTPCSHVVEYVHLTRHIHEKVGRTARLEIVQRWLAANE
jgi:hypothetical protein